MKRAILLYISIILNIGLIYGQLGEVVKKQPGEEYELKGEFGETGLALVKLRGKFGFIDKDGNEVIPLKYDDICCGSIFWKHNDFYRNFKWARHYNLLSVCLNGKWGLINKHGEIVIPLIYDKIRDYVSEEDRTVWAVKNGKHGCLNQKGEIVILFEFEDMQGAFYNHHPAYAKKDGKYGFIDEEGNVVVPFIYSTTRGFAYEKGSFAPVSINEKYGYINETGEVVIPLEYEFADSFEGDIAQVVKNNKVGAIDKKGNVVIPFQYDVEWSQDGHSRHLRNSFFGPTMVVKQGKYGIIDSRTGKQIVPFIYDEVGSVSSSGDIELKLNGKVFYFDRGGNKYNTKEERTKNKDLNLAKQGYPSYQYRIGYNYYYGKGGYTKDYSQAYEWFIKAAEGEYKDAQFYCGWMYEYGQGVTESIEKAMYWYQKSAQQGYNRARYRIGYTYYYGKEGYTKNYSKAYEWFIKAAEEGYKDAQFYCGWMHEYGQGVTESKEKAVYWYQKSAQQGYNRAKEALARLNIDINPNPSPVKKIATITWLAFNPVVKEKDCNIKIGIKSDSKIEEASVYVNGMLQRGIHSVTNDGYDMNINKTIALNEGKNSIKITVKNGAGISTAEKNIEYVNESVATIDWLGFTPTTMEKLFTLKAGIKSTSKIEAVTVSLNGVIDRGINPVKNDGYAMTIDKILTLAEGSNTIRIEVKNAGGISMTEKNVTYNIKKNPIIRQNRIALVMGNADYIDSDKKLRNPVNDATDVAAKLESLGFTVIRSLNQTQQEMEAAINRFGNQARNYDIALFYYAGHGISSQGNNYLVPIDANLPAESYVPYKCTNANLVLDLMDRAQCQMKIIILDACRNNPFARSWNRSTDGGGLNIMNAPKGTFIAFSTAPGDVAQDGEANERNSPHTAALLQTLDVPNLSITDFFQEVLEKVANKTNERQFPWTANSFRGKFFFNQQ